MSYNQVTIMGNVGSDPELTFFTSGGCVAKFSIADEIIPPKSSGREKRTQWIAIRFNDEKAESVAQHVKKGRAILVSGKLMVESYEDKDGAKRTVTYVRGFDWQFAGPRPADDGAPSGGRPSAGDRGATGFDPDELDQIPF